MQTRQGYFGYRKVKGRLWEVPYVRWGQAPMMYGLISTIVALKRKKDPQPQAEKTAAG